MSTRAELLDAIRARPEEDTPRLMYADWLDEHGDCDRDTATAEFIRLCCDNRQGKRTRMPLAAYKWLLDPAKPDPPHDRAGWCIPTGGYLAARSCNWYRLVPGLIALDQWAEYPREHPEDIPVTGPSPRARRNGREFHIWVGRYYPLVEPCEDHPRGRRGGLFTHAVKMTFGRGFVTEYMTWSIHLLAHLEGPMRTDQPLAKCDHPFAVNLGPELHPSGAALNL